MPKKIVREKLLSIDHDRDYQNLPTNEQEEFVDNNDQVPYVDNYWAAQPYPNWNQSMGTVPYVQYPPNVYYQPYDYQTTQPVQPHYLNTSELPPAPLGHNTEESEDLDVIPPSMNSAPVQQTVDHFVPMQNSQPLLPPPQSYYYPYSQPLPPPPPQSYYDPYSQPLPPPPPQSYYDSYSQPLPPPPPQSYYQPYSQPSPYYHSHPPSYYYYGTSSLPPYVTFSIRSKEIF